ncbi:DUF4153 domain-containing protein [Sphingomonas sp. CJ20]
MRIGITSRLVTKLVAAAGLVALADRLFWAGGGIGSNLGLFALAWAVVALVLTRAVWRHRASTVAAGFALLLAALLCDDPGPLGQVLFWNALALALLVPRVGGFDHAGRWALRLVLHGVTSVIGPWQDLWRARRHKRGWGRAQARTALALLPLPLVGGALFLALFASANPVIGSVLARIGMPHIDIARGIFWAVVLTLVWAALRPRRNRIALARASASRVFELPGVSTASVALALLTFNLLFAMQNGLDLAYLWSGAPLPEGVTLADYAHRGAYPLILTALLAGAFVLVALRPGSATAAVPAIRRLVVLWIAQNLLLVASTMLRTLDYVEVYSLTRLRIAALLWMGLVAVGLVLILWRMLRGKSAAWLINANAGAALLVLTGCSTIDLGSIAATWNVRHAREVGGKGAELDLCYLNQLGSSALVPIVQLEQRGGFTPAFTERLRWVRHEIVQRTEAGQQDGDWIWRDARRLAQVHALTGGVPLPAANTGPHGRDCYGSPRPAPTADAALTGGVPQ